MSVLIRHLVYYLFPNNYHGLSKKSLSGKLLETNLSCQRRMANFRGFPDEQWCSWNRIGKKREYQDIFSFSFEKNNLGQLSSLLTVQLYLHNSWKKWAANKANKLRKVVLCTIKIILPKKIGGLEGYPPSPFTDSPPNINWQAPIGGVND